MYTSWSQPDNLKNILNMPFYLNVMSAFFYFKETFLTTLVLRFM